MVGSSRPRPCHRSSILYIGDQVDAYGRGVAHAQHALICHVNAQFNKMPQLAMELQHERDGGMIPQGIGWGVSQPMSQ